MDILAQLDAAFATTSSAKKQKISHGKQQKKRIDPVYAPLDEEWSSAVVQMKMVRKEINGEMGNKTHIYDFVGQVSKWKRNEKRNVVKVDESTITIRTGGHVNFK